MPRLFDLFLRGGWVMWPLLVLSITAVAIAIERAWTLWRCDADAGPTIAALSKAYANGGDRALLEAGQRLGQPSSELVEVAVGQAAAAREDLAGALEVAGRDAVGRLGALLAGLRVIAEVAPLVGFFGTVLGIMTALEAITNAGGATTGDVAAGVSRALLTTAAGLLVAIPAWLAHAALQARLARVAATLERVAVALIAILAEEP